MSVSKSTRKADAEQVRLAERVIRQRLPLLKEITAKLAKIHNVASANQVGRELQFRGMFPRVQIRRPRNLDVGPNEIVALKHKVGQEIRSAFTDFKNQALRVQSIPGVGEGIDAKDLAEIDEIIDHWAIKPGEEAMPELVEPPPRSNRLAGPGPRGRVPAGCARPARRVPARRVPQQPAAADRGGHRRADGARLPEAAPAVRRPDRGDPGDGFPRRLGSVVHEGRHRGDFQTDQGAGAGGHDQQGGDHRRPVRDRGRAGQQHPGPGPRHRFRGRHDQGPADRGQARREMGGQRPPSARRFEARAVDRVRPLPRAGRPSPRSPRGPMPSPGR